MKKSLAVALAATLIATNAFAATTTKKKTKRVASTTSAQAAATAPASNNSGTSTASASSVGGSKLSDRLSITNVNIFYGPSINSGMYFPDEKTGEANKGAPAYMRNYLQANYKIDDNTVFGVSTYARTYMKDAVKDGAVTREAGMYYWELYARLRKPKLISQGAFNLYGDVRLYAPVSPNDRNQDMITASGQSLLATYAIPNTKLTVGLDLFAMEKVYSNRGAAAANGGFDLLGYAGPQIQYQLLPSLALTGLYEMETIRPVGSQGFGFVTSFTDAELGASWDINDRINLSPSLNFKTGKGQRINADTTSINTVLSIKLM